VNESVVAVEPDLQPPPDNTMATDKTVSMLSSISFIQIVPITHGIKADAIAACFESRCSVSY